MMSNIGEGATPLMYACQQSREREVLDIIARKRNSVRERDRTLKTPLHYCTENVGTGCAEAILRTAPELLDAKDEDGYTALHLAVIAGNMPFLRFLISRGANVNALDNEKHSAVHWATVCGEEEALGIILRAGAKISTADIHGGYPLHYAAQMCGPGGDVGRDSKTGLRILNILLSQDPAINVTDKDGRQPVLWAASAGSADAILALVKAGASVEASDKDGLTALHCAASRGHTDCIETLVTLCGAHIDIIDSNGCTALFYAVTLGHADATQLLLSLGAEPNRQDRKGRTPAHCGAAKGQLETLRILLNYGANLWLRNVKGDFPLHEAIASGRKDLVRWLLAQRGDSINVGNNDGRCPIHIAAINNNIDMIKILFDSQSLVNPIMRTTKGNMMTPLDAALHRGFRGCAKYLQLHGGVPFTKLTEKSSNLKGMSARQVTSEMYIDNYSDRLEISHWGVPPNSSASPPGFVPNQVRMGGDAAIQQIHAEDVRAVSRIRDDYEDLRSSDDERVYRRRRRRKKWEHQRKGYISEEDIQFEGEGRVSEPPRRRGKTFREDDLHRKREQYDESSSESDRYKRKAPRKKESSSDSEEVRESRRVKHSGNRKYRLAGGGEDSDDGGKIRTQRNSKSENVHESARQPVERKTQKSGSDKTIIIIPEDDAAPTANEAQEVSVIEAEVHREALPEVDNAPTEETSDLADAKPNGTPEKAADPAPEEYIEVENVESMASEDARGVEEVVEEVDEAASEAESKSRQEVAEEIENNVTEENVQGVEQSEEVEENPGTKVETVKVEETVNKAVVLELEVPVGAADEESTEKDETVDEVSTAQDLSLEIDATEGRSVNPYKEVEELVPEAEDDYGNDETPSTEIMQDEGAGEAEGNEEEEEEEEDEEDDEEYDEIDDNREGNAYEMLDHSHETRGNGNGGNNDEGTTTGRDMDSGDKPDTGEGDGSVEDESGRSTRNEDSSALPDSGIEPSPRRRPKDLDCDGDGDCGGSSTVRSRVPRLCNRGKDAREVHSVSVTQTVQNTIRKYHLERKIFYQLLELKRLQIRAGRANEQVLVKRLVDEYRRGGIIPGMKNYSGHYTFKQFERFLYDQLRTIQSTAHLLIPKLRPSDDIETLSTILKKTRLELVDDIPDNPIFCTQGTHRCHHAAHAYTGIPCAAYITKFNHHEMPKTRTAGFLPHIEQGYGDKLSGQQSYRPVTLELTHGKEKQVISLPTDRLDKNKRYYVTFTIKGGPALEESKSPDERTLRHRHAKSF